MNEFSRLYGADYFTDRFDGADPRREASYRQEIGRIQRYVRQGRVLDIGCGMGNFLAAFEGDWEKHGIEISDFAAEQARAAGIDIIGYGDRTDYFDLVLLRGVFQHLDTPLYDLKRALAMLRPGGYLVFLATPNTNSMYYKCFGTLPMLDPPRNFVLPSDRMLRQILENFGLTVEETVYPYLGSPYASPVRDHLKFLAKCLGFNTRFAFWRNMMEIYARKDGQ